MATRDLRFNVFANDRASAAFAKISAAAEALSNRLVRLDGQRASAKVEADTSVLEAKLKQAEAHLDTLQRKRSNPKIDADIAAAQAKMIQIANDLQELDRRRSNPRIDADITAAQTKILHLTKVIADLSKKESSPKINADIAAATAKIFALRDQIKSLEDSRTNPQITVEIAAAQAKLKQLASVIEELNRQKASPEVDANIAMAMAKIAAIKRQIADLNGTSIDIDASNSERVMTSLVAKIRDVQSGFVSAINSTALFTRNLRQITMPASMIAMVPTLASLGSAFATVSQAALLLPAAAGFAAAAVGTLALGFHDLVRAIGPRDTKSQIEKADLEMARLGEEAQQLARVVIDLKDEWNGLKKEVQNALFADLAEIFKSLAAQWMPMLQKGFVGIAGAFNDIAKDMNVFLREASTVDDASAMFSMFRMTVEALRPAFTNITEAFFDLGVVGSSFLPGLAAGFTNLTERFKDFMQASRDNGNLRLWIAQGIVAMHEFGTVIGNVGGIFGAFFEASAASGASLLSTLGKATGELKLFFQSAEGQTALIALFQGIRDIIESITPGIKALLSGIAEGVVIIQPAVASVGEAFSSFATAIAPTIPMLANLASNVVPPLAAAFSAVTNALGPLLPLLLTFAVTFKMMDAAGGILNAMGNGAQRAGTNMGMLGLQMGMSGEAAQRFETAGSKMSNVLNRVGNSLPLIGTAIIGLIAVYDAFGSKADELSSKVLKGSMSMIDAIKAEQQAVEQNYIFWFSAQQQKDEYAAAANRVRDAIASQLAVMDPLERATADVTLAESNYNEQVRIHGERSREASTASDILKGAKDRLISATESHTRATETSTEALVRNSQEVANAANADLNLERANLRLEEQQKRTTEALRQHSSSSIEGRQATLDLQGAYLAAAEAAQRKAQADAEARGEADAAAQGARAYRDRLIELAQTADGAVRDALIRTIANLDSTKRGENDAALAAAGLTDEIKKVPTQAVTDIKQPGMPEARANVKGLRDDIAGLKDHSFTIKANGEVVGVGRTGLATGGILPGYTPGRDVHNFVSPTGGALGLSGGEAVMRPEWTRVVGPDFIHAANRAARQGGVAGVNEFMSRVAPRPSGREGFSGDGNKFADGGIIGGALAGARAGLTVNNPTKYEWKGQTIKQWFAAAGAAIMKSYGGNALAWARTQVGKPYLWGGVGPGGYDCSGFMSAIVNVMRGRPPHSRVGATGNFPWSGFRGGLGPGLSIGSSTGNPGHMAGTLNGTNVESSGGVGVRVGGGARGASNAMFSTRAHLPFDDGGVANGMGYLKKMTLRPERMLSPQQTQSFDRLVGVLDTMRRTTPSAQVTAGDSATNELTRLRSDMQVLGETIRTSLSATRPITVEDRSGNPVETARATSLAIRLG